MRQMMTGALMALMLNILMLNTAQAAAPELTLPDLEGRSHPLSEYIGHGKWVVMVFWMHDCKICANEIHHLQAFHVAHADKDAMVLGISIDGADRVKDARRFVAKHKLTFPNLLTEPDFDALQKFGGGKFFGTPTQYFYDPTGRLVARKIGPMPRADIEAFIDAFNTSTFAAEPRSSPGPHRDTGPK